MGKMRASATCGLVAFNRSSLVMPCSILLPLLGRTGADYFSVLVTAELALAVPELRPLLIP